MKLSVLVFVVEDEVLIGDSLALALEDGGYSTIRVSNGEEAIAILDERKNDIRALITDVNLGRGRLTGWDVARHGRQLNPALPVVYMTGANAHE
jgi:CheY-like chemotaxis protein